MPSAKRDAEGARVSAPRAVGVGLAVGAAFAALGGCTATQPGQANAAAPGPTSAYRAPTNDPAAASLPPRPKDVPVAGVDPCALITAGQRAGLGVTAGVPGPPAVHGGRTCEYRFTGAVPGAVFTVAAVADAGIQTWLDPTLADNVRPASVGGFPALDITTKGTDLLQGCTTAVSVANGQMITVQLGLPPRGTTTAQSCARTNQVAAAALTTVQTLK